MPYAPLKEAGDVVQAIAEAEAHRHQVIVLALDLREAMPFAMLGDWKRFWRCRFPPANRVMPSKVVLAAGSGF